MTTNPLSPVTFTAEERAILDGTSTVKVEETDGTGDGAGAPGNDSVGRGERPEGDGEEAGVRKEADVQDEHTAEEEGEEEVIEVADGTNPDGTPRRKVISYSAFRKADARAKKLADELRSTKEQVAYLTGLSQNAQITQKPAPQQPAAQELSETPPDKTREPEKYLAWLEAVAQETVRMRRQSVQQTEQQTQFQQINQAVAAHEHAFRNGDQAAGIEAHPDFDDALKFLQDRHKAELKEAGYEPHEIQQIMVARAQSVALKALQAGKSPAERVYSLAKLNGYKRAQPKPVETEAEKIARQAESQKKAGKTISALPGGESKGGLTAETLANMDPAEFLKMWNKGEAKALMGWKD
jgi:hypothetical protein